MFIDVARQQRIAQVAESYFKQKVDLLLQPRALPPELFLLKRADGQVFVVKHLKQHSWLGKRYSHTVEQRERIASQLAETIDACLPSCLWTGEQYLLPEINDRVLVSPYCQGEISLQLTVLQAEQLGRTLALIHGCNLKKSEMEPFPLITMHKDSPLKHYQQAVEHCNAYRFHARHEWCYSHRDIHPGNVIWQVGGFKLIDWESAGAIHPFVELIGVALNVSGISSSSFDTVLFSRVIMAYKAQCQKLPRDDEALWQLCQTTWLLWMEYNFKIQNDKEVKNTIKALELMQQVLPEMKTLYRHMVTH